MGPLHLIFSPVLGDKIQALINFENEVNTMTPTFTAKLSFVTHKTDAGAQKINGLPLVTYGMVLASFSVQDKLEKIWFFRETFLLADTSMEVVLGMLFLTLSDAAM